ncbi:hypothetical protein A0J61_11066 [Choanephora cucurbitarum]|uniref:Uncharacterized protein n=1 Tax=Choanephora cucurbitarum TaxID=101091 RepID=A0A1C7MVG3_9FUNG|nr:hypothetical protein A0J61_11066 [Choanephora cucurbitarum]
MRRVLNRLQALLDASNCISVQQIYISNRRQNTDSLHLDDYYYYWNKPFATRTDIQICTLTFLLIRVIIEQAKNLRRGGLLVCFDISRIYDIDLILDINPRL